MTEIWKIIKEWLSLPLSDRTLVILLLLIFLFIPVSGYLYKQNLAQQQVFIDERNQWKAKYDSLSVVYVNTKIDALTNEIKKTDSLLREANRIKLSIKQILPKK
jgi:hypothetical protein